MADDGARTWILTVTRVTRFAASIGVTGEMFEDRTRLWPDSPAGVSA
jgi:hypothetical protein